MLWYNMRMNQKDKSVQQELLGWYESNKRDLPWRKASGVYAVLVSEMMLQQTRVDTVIGYYERFMARFPNAAALAAASEDEVLHAWQGLGYYRRARNLHAATKMVTENGGVFPQTQKEWLRLPGVGHYIAGAVMSIAQGLQQPAVDGNVLRVIARLMGSKDDIALPATRKVTEKIVRGMMPKGRPGDFTQALMELGALVCTPASPKCADCPLTLYCAAYRGGTTQDIPVKTKKARPKTVRLWAAAVIFGECILLEQRGEGLLGGMWGVPVAAREDGSADDALSRQAGLTLYGGTHIGRVVHVFTHQRWEMDVMRYDVSGKACTDETLEWVRIDSLGSKAVPTAFKKVLALL